MEVYDTWWIHIPEEIVEVQAETVGQAKQICYRLCRGAEFPCEFIEFRARRNYEGKLLQKASEMQIQHGVSGSV